MELIEGASGGVHGLVALPSLWDHHEHRMRERTSPEVQQLEHLIERG